MSGTYFLQMRGISKSFPGVRALQNVSLAVRRGEVHALVGENGAGKSTLMKILSGAYRMDSGQILINANPVEIHSPAHAQELGISTIHQEFNLINGMTVAENMFLSHLPVRGPARWIEKAKMNQEAASILQALGLDVDPRIQVRRLRVAQQQIVEVGKALTHKAQLIIMDEPTAALTDVEIERLFQIIRDLKAKGVAVIYISHKLDEIYDISDYVTVLRDGQNVGNSPTSEMSREEMIRLMVGREVHELYPKREAEQGEVILSVRNLNVKGLLKDISFDLRRGEILGVAGLMGAGQIHLARALFGLYRLDGGQVFVQGHAYLPKSPAHAIQHGLGLLTENRKEEGLVLSLSVAGNVSLASVDRVTRGGWVSRKREDCLASEMVDKLDIRPPETSRVVRYLSGGNQQKVVLAKWLATEPDIIILVEPTRGVDVGAKAEIYRLMGELVAQGKALLFISSELPEILGLSDRILVMRSGTVGATLEQKEATAEIIMRYATGGKASA